MPWGKDLSGLILSHRTLVCFYRVPRKSKRPRPDLSLLRWAAHAGEGRGPARSEFRSGGVTEQGVCLPRPGWIRPGNLAYPSPGTRRGLPRGRASSSQRGLPEPGPRRLPDRTAAALKRSRRSPAVSRGPDAPAGPGPHSPSRGRTPATRFGHRAGLFRDPPQLGRAGAPRFPPGPTGRVSASGMSPEGQAPAGNGPRRLPSPSLAP